MPAYTWFYPWSTLIGSKIFFALAVYALIIFQSLEVEEQGQQNFKLIGPTPSL